MAKNGYLDLNTLTKVPLTAGGFGYLENLTAQGWFAARNDLIATTGVIPVLIPDGLYRDYARQVYWKTYWTRLGKPENAATPGTSNHGLGLAVDVNNISAYKQSTLDAVMGRHGFVRDTSETWHYHHTSVNPADSSATPIPEIIPTLKENEMYVVNDVDGSGSYVVTADGATGILAGVQSTIYRLQQLAPGARLDLHKSEIDELNAVLRGNARLNTAAINLTPAQITAIANAVIAQSGSFTATDRAMLDDIANKGELGAALTNTVNLVNSHADANKAQIIQEIDTHSGSSLSAFTATITPVE